MATFQTLAPKIATKTALVDMQTESIAWDQGSHANGIQFINDGKTFLFVFCSAAVGVTVAFDDIPDQYGRGDTASPVIAAGDIGIFGPFLPHLWNHSGYVQALPTSADASILYAAVRLDNPS